MFPPASLLLPCFLVSSWTFRKSYPASSCVLSKIACSMLLLKEMASCWSIGGDHGLLLQLKVTFKVKVKKRNLCVSKPHEPEGGDEYFSSFYCCLNWHNISGAHINASRTSLLFSSPVICSFPRWGYIICFLTVHADPVDPVKIMCGL